MLSVTAAKSSSPQKYSNPFFMPLPLARPVAPDSGMTTPLPN
jgi:hypothetical protein